MAEKKNRRRSKIFTDLCLAQPEEDILLQSEQVKAIYLNKNYEPPPPTLLETLFEGCKRGFSVDGSLIIGKCCSVRTIEPYKFWKQNDVERNKRRKSMTRKLFKGRVRPKHCILNSEKELALQELIEASDSIFESSIRNLSYDLGTGIEDNLQTVKSNGVLDVVLAGDKSDQKIKPHSEIEERDQLNDNSPKNLADHYEASVHDRLQPCPQENLAEGCHDNQETQVHPGSREGNDMSQQHPNGEDNSDLLSLLRSSECSEVLKEFEGKVPQDLIDLMTSDEIMFCNKNEGKKRRKRDSVRRSIRRSARFLNDNDTQVGSYFLEEDESNPSGLSIPLGSKFEQQRKDVPRSSPSSIGQFHDGLSDICQATNEASPNLHIPAVVPRFDAKESAPKSSSGAAITDYAKPPIDQAGSPLLGGDDAFTNHPNNSSRQSKDCSANVTLVSSLGAVFDADNKENETRYNHNNLVNKTTTGRRGRRKSNLSNQKKERRKSERLVSLYSKIADDAELLTDSMSQLALQKRPEIIISSADVTEPARLMEMSLNTVSDFCQQAATDKENVPLSPKQANSQSLLTDAKAGQDNPDGDGDGGIVMSSEYLSLVTTDCRQLDNLSFRDEDDGRRKKRRSSGADIALPDAVRRSLTGEFVPNSLPVEPAVSLDHKGKQLKDVTSFSLESDSEEEEVFLTGMNRHRMIKYMPSLYNYKKSKRKTDRTKCS